MATPTNEIIDEVRRIREEIAAECNYDLGAYFAWLRKQPLPPGFEYADLKPVEPKQSSDPLHRAS